MNPLHRTPRRPLDLLSVRGPSHIVQTDAAGARSFGAISALAPDVLDAWDRYLDSKDPANEDPLTGRLPA